MSKPQPAGNQVSSGDSVFPSEPEVTIFVTNGVRTSQGPGPGVKVLPASEAGAIVSMKYAVYGDRDPSQSTGPEPVVKRFGSPPARRPAQSN